MRTKFDIYVFIVILWINVIYALEDQPLSYCQSGGGGNLLSW